jgi:hypothetical protein
LRLPQSQQPPQRPVQGERPAKPVSEDEPVAVTERKVVETAPTSEPLGPNQFGTFYGAQINNEGDVIFLGRYTDVNAPGRFGQGIFVKTKSGSWRYVRNADKVSNLNEKMINVGPFNVASNGNVIFTATFGRTNPLHKQQSQPAGDESLLNSANSNLGIFVWKDGVVSNLYHLGMEVPNLPSRFSSFSNPSINSKGAIAFVAAYVDPDGRGLFHIEDGKLRIAARSGQKISPTETVTFSEHFYPSRINEKGEVAFFARLGNGSAIMVSRPSGIDIIARDNTLSPVKGAKYIGFGNRAPTINDKGDVAYAGFYSGPNAGRALFLKPAVGPARIVARTGDPTSKLAFSDFMQPSLNNRGDVVFVGRTGGRIHGVFLKTARGLEVIARSDELPPGYVKGAEFNNFHMPSVNDQGEVVFYAYLKNAKFGIFKKDASGLKMFLQRGDAIPFDATKTQ